MMWMRRVGMALIALAAIAWADGDESKPKKKKPDFPPWSEIGKEMEGTKGFWNYFHNKKKTKFWVEIPSSHLNKPFLLATSVSGGSTMAGHQWNDWLLVWQVHDKKLVLLERNVGVTGKDKEIQEAVKRTYTDRVLSTYRIMARGPNGGYVIDGSGMFASGASLFFGGMGRSKDSSLAKFDKSRNFENNTEISVTMPSAGRGNLQTLHYSISRLSSKGGYKPRMADDRIGFFITRLKDFSSDNRDENRYLRYINRWHLAKKKKDIKLSPPAKSIEFIIEKTVPVQFRRYVREGILEWNTAFREIGFYDPIVVYQQTNDNEHKDKAPEDVRYNFFRWIVSDMPFAMGPSRVNPMTGQILDADILFDDSYIRFTLEEYRLAIRKLPTALTGTRGREMLKSHPLARLGFTAADDEFFHAVPADAVRPNISPLMRRAFCSHGNGIRHQIATCGLWLAGAEAGGATPEKADVFPEELIGQFIKDTVMHEVGHTLGLRHNFKASTYRTREEIFAKESPGDLASSVMDYLPIAIAPEDKPQGNYAMTTLGPYDVWAIQYGYTTDEKELKKIVARVAEKGHDYATDEDTWSDDPLVDTWDLGADPLQYARDRVALMKRLRKDLEARAVQEGESYNRLRRAMDMQFYEGRGAGATAAKFIGGEVLHRDHRGDPNARPPMVPVSAAKQREALAFVCDEFLSGRYFVFSDDQLRKVAPDFWVDDFFALFFGGYSYPYLENVQWVQSSLVYGLTSPDRLNRVVDARHKMAAGADVLTVPEIFDAVQGTIFKDLATLANRPGTNKDPSLNDMQRNLQREYVSHLIFILLEGEGWYSPTVQTLARHYVKRLAGDIGMVLKTQPNLAADKRLDTSTTAHLEECQAKLERALEASYTLR